jgi:hypothetical protein
MRVEDYGGKLLTGKNVRIRRKTYPIANFSTTNPKQTDPDANPRLHGERSATNRLSRQALAVVSQVDYWGGDPITYVILTWPLL